jgi:SAM-dependent methyltransferase
VFVNQDGIVVCATVRALDELGILTASLAAERTVAELYPELTPEAHGYLNVGLRCLASQGWLEPAALADPDRSVVRWTEAGRAIRPYLDRYIAAGRFLASFDSPDDAAWTRPWHPEQVDAFAELAQLARDRWRLGAELSEPTRELVAAHLDAALLVPAMLWLPECGRLGGEGPRLPDDPHGAAIGSVLTTVGWLGDDGRSWTAAGRDAAKLAVHFGMAGSYLPMFARLPELFRGQVAVATSAGQPEWHVHRRLNVLASATAHKRYFADADGLFLEIFNRRPVGDQPRFIADMGCGDGSWLLHLYELIVRRTLRGELRDEFPLVMVGIDYSLTALAQTRRLLEAAGVPAMLICGDISDPDDVGASLAERGLEMRDGLHIRAFIDHNRAYRGGGEELDVAGVSSGAYVGPDGRRLDATAVERDLAAHLRRWAPHAATHGLVVLEAHCVDPAVAREHLGATHSVAFDAYHGYSHQYPCEHTAFLRCAALAGFRFASEWERRYPSSRPFVAVTLSRLLPAEPVASLPAAGQSRSPRADTWRPAPDADLTDGVALHELMYTGGDLNQPRSWASAATGYVAGGALAAVQARLAEARAGDVIRVLDYGAGTGLAALEFLKGCRERRIDRQLELAEVTLEVHLVDLPSSWFAFGFELLRGCGWTTFHSLSDADGRFRRPLDVTGGRRMDVVMSNMVFHLIRPRALQAMATGLAEVTADGGTLIWSAPDIGPAGPYAVLFHDANRALRRRWVDFLDGGDLLPAGAPDAPALHAIRAGLDAEGRERGAKRASRRVLPDPNTAQAVVEALASAFGGASELRLETHELLAEDVVDTLLVPSNQGEYLPEIEDRALRERLIRELMVHQVLPALRAGGAGTARGLSVQWTLGTQVRRR